MADIKPFTAVRFGGNNVSKLICPPYDIISDKARKKLTKSSLFNFVRLELPEPKGSIDKYENAAAILTSWLEKGVLARDNAPSFYIYEQVFSDHGKKMVRRGFFAALKLEKPGAGGVKPHEKTLAKPKEDRLNLIRAVRANLSPIFGLYGDKGKVTVKLFAKISKTDPVSSARDSDGVIHKLWQAGNPADTNLLRKALKSQNVFIADGHHRYETAWNYSQECGVSGYCGCGYVMTFLCPMEDQGLSIWPTHRVVELPRDFDTRINKYFDVLPASIFKKCETKLPQVLLLYRNGKMAALKIKNSKILSQFMPDKCKSYRELGVSVLHSVLLHDVAPDKITYVKDEKEAVALAKKRGMAAVIVPATPIEAVKKIALAGQTMPQKSTYFYPKVASGMAVYAL